MCEPFIDLVKALFPISPYTLQKAYEWFRQYRERQMEVPMVSTPRFDFLAQGDILESLIFVYQNDEGDEIQFEAKAFLLSNTCDAENDQNVLFCPCFSLDRAIEDCLDIQTLKTNRYNRLFYLPSHQLGDNYVDLSIANSCSANLIRKMMSQGKIVKIGTLTLYGFYFLLAKLTIHFMRPEDVGVASLRSKFEKTEFLLSG